MQPPDDDLDVREESGSADVVDLTAFEDGDDIEMLHRDEIDLDALDAEVVPAPDESVAVAAEPNAVRRPPVDPRIRARRIAVAASRAGAGCASCSCCSRRSSSWAPRGCW